MRASISGTPRRRDGPRRRPLIVIRRQLGHSTLGITSVYSQGIDSGEIIESVQARRAPMIAVSASLRLWSSPRRHCSSRKAALSAPPIGTAGEA